MAFVAEGTQADTVHSEDKMLNWEDHRKTDIQDLEGMAVEHCWRDLGTRTGSGEG